MFYPSFVRIPACVALAYRRASIETNRVRLNPICRMHTGQDPGSGCNHVNSTASPAKRQAFEAREQACYRLSLQTCYRVTLMSYAARCRP